MIVHMVLFEFGRPVGADDIGRLSDAFERLRGIEDVRYLVHGEDMGVRPRTVDYAMTAHFADTDALARYIDHPAHRAVVGVLESLQTSMTIAQIPGPGTGDGQ